MARVTNQSDAGLSGKLIDRVYVKYFDTTYVRKAPTVRKDSRTRGQLLNQQRFREINRFCKQFKNTPIARIWQDAAVNTTGYRLFLKANSSAFAKDGSMGDYRLLRLTTGKLLLPLEITGQREVAEPATIRVCWTQDHHIGGERLRDELMVMAQANGVFSGMTPTGLGRRSCGGTFPLPLSFEGATHLYLFMASSDRWDYSQSFCLEI
ncbi:MAG: hypothetical protein H7X84_04950 [Verrucomicrobia bacterium]|nr:hypothetical protein [Prolixibacteraceae bacterium]